MFSIRAFDEDGIALADVEDVNFEFAGNGASRGGGRRFLVGVFDLRV